MTKLLDVEGIGETYALKLKGAGIGSLEALLEKGATPKGRKELAETSGISEKLILEWVNHADLYRIKGVGSEYSDLLEEAGVDTVVNWRSASPKTCTPRLAEINAEKKLVRKLPTLKQVQDWVAQAAKLERKVHY